MTTKSVSEGKLTPHALAGLFKKLEGNRGAAFLLVSDGLSEKCLYFSVGAIRLSSWGRRRVRTLDDALAKHPKVAPEVLARARKRGEDIGESLEDALANMDYAEVVRECSTLLVRDELLDLIVWDGAVYEYVEANPPPKIFDPRLQALKLSFGVPKLLKEAADGVANYMRGAGKFGQGHARLVRGSTYSYGPPEAVDPTLAEILVDTIGESGATVDDVFLAFRRKGIDVLRASAALETCVDKRTFDAAKAQSVRLSKDEALAAGQKEIAEIESALEFLINELAARQRLASTYQSIGDDKKAVHNLKRVGEELAARNRGEEAVDTYRQVIGLAPNDFGARERIIQLFEKMKRIPDALAEGGELASLFKQFGLFNRAKLVFRHMLRLDPAALDTRRALIELLVRLRENGEAVEEYEALAELLREQHDDDQVLAIYQQILKLDPNHQNAHTRVRAVARRRWSFLVPYIAVAAGFAILLGISAYVIAEYRVVRDFAEMRKKAFERALADDFIGARAAVKDFLVTHEGRRSEIAVLTDEIAAIEREHRQRLAAEDYAKGRALEAEKRGMEARSVYSALVATGRGTEWETKAQDRIRAIDLDIDEAERIAAAVRRLYHDGKDRDAYDKARELLRRFSWTEAARECDVPLAIETVPPGAAIAVDRREQTARTPCVRPFKPIAPFTLTLSMKGFAPESRLVDLREEVPYPYHVELKKALVWKATTLGPVDAPPAVAADAVFLGGRDQRVYSVWPDGRLRWSRALGVFADVLGRTLRAGPMVVVGDRAGQVTGLDADGGEVKWRTKLAGPASGVAATRDVAVIASQAAIIGFDAASGKERWRASLPSELAAPPVSGEDGVVVAVATDGTLLAIEPETGRELGRFNVGGRAVVSPGIASSGYLVATEDRLLRLLAARDGHEIWRQKLGAAATGPPLATAATAYVPAGDKVVALDLRTGAERWSFDVRSEVRAAPTATRGGRLYVGASDGAVYALASETGTLRWKFRTGGEILAQPLATADTVYVASTDFTVYAIADN
jgi:outer membrane protein assembly factor BamB/tetratricopeptide (TPR) repeat protein